MYGQNSNFRYLYRHRGEWSITESSGANWVPHPSYQCVAIARITEEQSFIFEKGTAAITKTQ